MKKNVASQIVGVQMVNATTGAAFTSAVTVSVTLDGGTQATGTVGSGACTHEGNGYHTYTPSQAETNGDLLAYTFTGTGAIPVSVQIYTSFPQTVDHATNIANIQTRIPAALTGAGNIKADALALGGTTLTGRDIGASVLLSPGTGTGQIDLTAGVPKANATQFAGQTITAAAGVTLPGTVASPTNITAGVLTSVGSAGAIGTGGIIAASFAAGAIDASAIATDAIGSAELATSAVAEIVAAVWAQAMTELAAVPGVTDTVLNALQWVFLQSRNKITQTASTQLLRNNADGATIGSAAVSDDGTTFIRGVFS